MMVVFEKDEESPSGAVLLDGRANWIRAQYQDVDNLLRKILPLVPALGTWEEFLKRKVGTPDMLLRFLDQPAEKAHGRCDNALSAYRCLRAEFQRRFAAAIFIFLGLATLSLADDRDSFQQARDALDPDSPLREHLDADADHFLNVARHTRGVYFTTETSEALVSLFFSLRIPVWGAVHLDKEALPFIKTRCDPWEHPYRTGLKEFANLEIPNAVQLYYRDTRSTDTWVTSRTPEQWREWLSDQPEIDSVEEARYPPQSVRVDRTPPRAPSAPVAVPGSAPASGESLDIPADGPPRGSPVLVSDQGVLVFRCPASDRRYLYHPNVPFYSGWIASEIDGGFRVTPLGVDGRVSVTVLDHFSEPVEPSSASPAPPDNDDISSARSAASSAHAPTRPVLPVLQTSYGPPASASRLRRRTPSDTGDSTRTGSSSSASAIGARDRSVPPPPSTSSRAQELRDVLAKRPRLR